MAKIILATMVAFAILLLASMFWMPRRVHKRGSFGRKTSAVLRGVYPLALGLGGWFLASLSVMTVWPSIPLGNELLAILPIGTAIGLGVCWAWVHRAWARTTKITGVSAAVGGAFAGAWFGFTSTTGLLALVTSIV